MEQYQQTGAMSEQDYMDTAAEEMKEANEKYEGKETGTYPDDPIKRCVCR